MNSKDKYRNVVVDGDKITGERLVPGHKPCSMKVYTYPSNGPRIEETVWLDGEPFWVKFEATRKMLHISWAIENPKALRRIWNLQDGYGAPGTTPGQGFDWSGIRDSSPEAMEAMYEVACSYLPVEKFDEILKGGE